MASTEGYPFDRDKLVALLIDDLKNCNVFEYGDVVFTVGKIEPVAHVYADDSGCGLLIAARKFMRDVWRVTEHQYIFAPIMNERVKRFVSKFGWASCGKDWTGFEIFRVERRA